MNGDHDRRERTMTEGKRVGHGTVSLVLANMDGEDAIAVTKHFLHILGFNVKL